MGEVQRLESSHHLWCRIPRCVAGQERVVQYRHRYPNRSESAAQKQLGEFALWGKKIEYSSLSKEEHLPQQDDHQSDRRVGSANRERAAHGGVSFLQQTFEKEPVVLGQVVLNHAEVAIPGR